MSIGLVGRKFGMSRVFLEDGESVPVTVIQALPNRITRIKTADQDGYTALQVTTGSVKPSRVSKVVAGQYKASAQELGEGLWEFRIEPGQAAGFEAGGELTVENFTPGQIVDVIGTTIGKGLCRCG